MTRTLQSTSTNLLLKPPINRGGGTSGAQLIDHYLAESYVLTEDWDSLPLKIQESILFTTNRSGMLNLLVDHGLLTEYQAGRIDAGTTFGLVLGSYRILDRIGAGGMAVVFRAEHVDLRHVVAIKVLPSSTGQDTRVENRFFAEMRTIANLRHPNIVAATDAGRLANPDPNGTSYRYLVMEYVPGKDLDEYIAETGPLAPGKACALIYQIASALAETNKFKLVHRDIKPSNIMVTAEEQAKLLDFGLSMHFHHRMTVPGTVLGTIDFMAPEQARDASSVDIRADIYSLGGTLFYALTGHLPFEDMGNAMEALARRLTTQPPLISAHLRDCPEGLDRFVSKMMALDPADRFQTPQDVMRGLLRFIRIDSPEHQCLPIPIAGAQQSARTQSAKTARVLVVDDEEGAREFARHLLDILNLQCDLAGNGEEALDAIQKTTYDLVLLDMILPEMSGKEVLLAIRADDRFSNMKVILVSGQAPPDELSQLMNYGADDFLSKPFSAIQFQGRLRTALRLKAVQDRSIYLNQELVLNNAQLKHELQSREMDLSSTRRALVMGLSRLVELRDSRGMRHLTRMQRYARTLAEAAAKLPEFEHLIDGEFADTLECCVPLHDVGKICLPDHILMKAGILTDEERILMQTHTTFAAETFHEVARDYPAAVSFMRMAIDVIRHHHERFDGSGYPDKLAGNSIPLSARIVSICDVYDALRSRKSHRPPLSHAATCKIIQSGSTGQFDPILLSTFRQIAAKFEQIYQDDPN